MKLDRVAWWTYCVKLFDSLFAQLGSSNFDRPGRHKLVDRQVPAGCGALCWGLRDCRPTCLPPCAKA